MSNNPNELLGETLFGKVRRSVLAAFVLNPERSFYLLELIRLLECGRGAVQREVSRLSRAGVLTREKIGNQVHYRANTENLIYSELRSIFSKTTGLLYLLKSCLDNCSTPLGMAFIYGEYAEGSASENSPVNLYVIGDLPMDALRSCTEGFRDGAARELHITVTTPAELKRRISSGEKRVKEILLKKKVFLAGGEKELRVLSTVGDDLFAGLF
jgi:hypothetical protein